MTDRWAPIDATVLQASETHEQLTLAAPSNANGGNGADSATQVTSGGVSSCALPEGGRLYCWGGGAIGDGSLDGRPRPSPSPG